jgi:hypothetical protein
VDLWLPNLRNLNQLQVQFNRLTAIRDGAFANCTKLATAYFNDNRLHSLPSELADLPDLSVLTMGRNSFYCGWQQPFLVRLRPGVVKDLDQFGKCIGCFIGQGPSLSGASCVKCANGTFSPAGRNCTRCAINTWSGQGAATCRSCGCVHGRCNDGVSRNDSCNCVSRWVIGALCDRGLEPTIFSGSLKV